MKTISSRKSKSGRRNFDWLEPDLRQKMAAMLSSPMPRGREQLVYRALPRHLERSDVDGRRHILFICYYPYLNSIKKSAILRGSNKYYTSLLACCIREDMQIDRYFDQAYEVSHYSELSQLLARARPAAVNITIQPAGLAALVREALPDDVRQVVDVYDSHFFMTPDPATPESRLEQAVLRYCRLWTHKMPAAAVNQMRAAWDVRAPSLQTLALPWSEFFVRQEPAAPPPYQLVFAGGIMPVPIAKRDGHAHMIIDPIVERTAHAGLELSIYVHQNARNMFWEEQQHYFDLSRQYPHFRFQPGVPFHRLAREIAGFHYGLLYDNMELSTCKPELFWYNISTKFFSYLEAGLPVLIYDGFRHMAEIVQKHGLGLVYSLDRLEELPELLHHADYGAMKNAVLAFRQTHELQTTLPLLEQLYG